MSKKHGYLNTNTQFSHQESPSRTPIFWKNNSNNLFKRIPNVQQEIWFYYLEVLHCDLYYLYGVNIKLGTHKTELKRWGQMFFVHKTDRQIAVRWSPLPWKLKFQELMQFFYRWFICKMHSNTNKYDFKDMVYTNTCTSSPCFLALSVEQS